ncbi:uncharacterized protein PAC_02868 [Phialocephala subalpina]|uniref:Hsp70 protein n=1 Tax=Phialocephala subalpina TaxID=576137 RepID=A0A1L7WJQ7_9HELO|nr:uncharacterized protein PAC_02868 [Phialocephala subalpina]
MAATGKEVLVQSEHHPDPRVTINNSGIDFGTTYSSATWAWSGCAGVHQVVKCWDGIGGQRTSGKVPTRISYKGNQINWGFNIPPEEKPTQWFKLLLLRPEDMDDKIQDYRYIKEAREPLLKLNKLAEQVVADYLRLLWRHIIKDMKLTLGEAAVDSHLFQVVVTFPTIRRFYAQSRMRQAVTVAGILDARSCGETRLYFCAESEVAALAIMEDYGGTPVDSGDAFVVCDAGGGTVDLITYELLDADSWKLAECVAGAGSLCGATFVDGAFDQQMSKWMAPKIWQAFAENEKIWWKDESETAKPKIRNHRLQLQRNDIASIFDVCVDQIVTLVQNQIQTTRASRGILPKEIIEPFDDRLHKAEDRIYVASVDGFCAMHQMYWYIRAASDSCLLASWNMCSKVQNEVINDQAIIKLDWSKTIRGPLRGNRFTVILWRCDQESPSSRMDDDVLQEGVIACTVGTPFEQLPRYTNSQGEVWMTLEF